jgi:hypothetical protein
VEDQDSAGLPKAVRNWVRSNQRMLGLLDMLQQIEREKELVAHHQAWTAAKLSEEIVAALDQNRGTLEQVAGTVAHARIVEAFRSIRGFSDQVEIIRFEVAKAEKEWAEQNVDLAAQLKRQRLYRPKMPAENWNYWTFQGEFWRDEIGYYQYTLKRGCPAASSRDGR